MPPVTHASAFRNPVLLFNGDSHIYRSDNPLQAGAPCTMENPARGTETTCAQAATDNPGLNITADAWQNHPSYAVTNIHRVTVVPTRIPRTSGVASHRSRSSTRTMRA